MDDVNLPRKKRLKVTAIFFAAVVCIFLVGFFYWLFIFRHEKYTDDAYVEGNQVVLTPLRSGFVTGIFSDDTFFVEKGQLLVQLDETDSKIAFDTAKEKLAATVREVCQMFHQLFAYEHEIRIRKAELLVAMQDLEHRNNVIEQGGVSLEDLEHAQGTYTSAVAALKKTQSLYLKQKAMLQGKSITTHPFVLEASENLKQAWVDLYRCKIYAPVDGLIAQRRAQVGMWFQAGDPLLNVIPLDQIWVNANYKETQMKHMRIGQKVRLTSDLYGRDIVYHGKIVGLPGGAGNAFSILPPQNLSGNWIKIVQRLPVRVALYPEEIKRNPLRIGLTMSATVDIRDSEGLLVPNTNKGPNYCTKVYKKEESGSESLVQKVVKDNIDPSLVQFEDTPLYWDQYGDEE